MDTNLLVPLFGILCVINGALLVYASKRPLYSSLIVPVGLAIGFIGSKLWELI